MGEKERYKDTEEPLDRRVYPLAFSMFFTGVSTGVILPILPSLALDLGLSSTEFGTVIGAYGLAKLAGNVPVAHYLEVLGRRPFLTYPYLAIAAGVTGVGLASSCAELQVCRLLAGLGVAGFANAAFAVVSDVSTERNRTRSVAPLFAAFSAGSVIGPAVGGLMAGAFGIQATCTLVGVAFASIAVLNHVLLDETKPMGGPGEDKDTARKTLREAVGASIESWGKVLREGGQVVHMVIFNGAYQTAIAGAQMTLLPMFLCASPFSFSPAELGAAFACMSLVTVASSQPLARIADRHGRIPCVVAAGLLTGGAMLAVPVIGLTASSSLLLAPALATWAVGSPMLSSAPMSFTMDAVADETQRTHTLSLLRSLGDTGQLVGAAGSGFLASTLGIDTAMAANGMLLVAASGWLWRTTTTL